MFILKLLYFESSFLISHQIAGAHTDTPFPAGIFTCVITVLLRNCLNTRVSDVMFFYMLRMSQGNILYCGSQNGMLLYVKLYYIFVI